MKVVRDDALEDFEMIFEGKMKTREAKLLFEFLQANPHCREIVETAVAYAVDKSIHKFLRLFETNDEFSLSALESSEVINLNLVSDGLAGELYGDGWIFKYSEYPPSILGR